MARSLKSRLRVPRLEVERGLDTDLPALGQRGKSPGGREEVERAIDTIRQRSTERKLRIASCLDLIEQVTSVN